MGWKVLSPAQALAMREEENRVILKPVLIAALRTINGIGAADAEAIYNDLSTLSDNEEWQRKLRGGYRSEEHTSELQSLMRISYAVFCLKNKRKKTPLILEHT